MRGATHRQARPRPGRQCSSRDARTGCRRTWYRRSDLQERTCNRAGLCSFYAQVRAAPCRECLSPRWQAYACPHRPPWVRWAAVSVASRCDLMLHPGRPSVEWEARHRPTCRPRARREAGMGCRPTSNVMSIPRPGNLCYRGMGSGKSRRVVRSRECGQRARTGNKRGFGPCRDGRGWVGALEKAGLAARFVCMARRGVWEMEIRTGSCGALAVNYAGLEGGADGAHRYRR